MGKLHVANSKRSFPAWAGLSMTESFNMTFEHALTPLTRLWLFAGSSRNCIEPEPKGGFSPKAKRHGLPRGAYPGPHLGYFLKVSFDETLWNFFVLFFGKMDHFWNIFGQAFEENHRLSMKRTLFGPKPGSDIGVKMWYYVTWRHDMLIVHIFTSMVMLSSLAIVLSSLGMICYHHRHDIWAGLNSCVQRVWVTRLRKCSPDESKCSFEACFEGVMMIQLIVLSSLAYRSIITGEVGDT